MAGCIREDSGIGHATLVGRQPAHFRGGAQEKKAYPAGDDGE